MTPAELIAAFETLTEAPDGVVQLRELILQLAVRGKLTPQDARDEPASVLLGERAMQPATLPFLPPAGWSWSCLGLLGRVVGGGTPSKTNPRFWGGTIPWVTPKDMKRDRIADAIDHITDAAVDGSAAKRIAPGALLMVVRGMILAHSFPTALTEVEVTINQDMKALVPCSRSLAPFLLLLSKGSKHRVLKLVERSTHGTCKLDTEDLLRLPLPIPPLAEQHRIVARVDELIGLLDRLEAARTKREATRAAARDSVLVALREADSPEAVDAAWTRFAQRMDDLLCDPADIAPLRQAVLQLAVRGRLVRQDPKDEPVAGLAQNVVARRRTSRGQSADSSVEPLFSVPSNWRWLRMDAVTDLASGVTKGRSLVGRKTTALPYLRVANVQAGFLDLKVIKTIDVPNDEIDEGLLLRGGDVLLTEGGDWDKLGRSAIWNGEVSPCTHQNHVFRARPVGGMNSRWISMFTNSPDGRTYFQSCAKRTTNLASINMTQLRACPVPVPPVAEQHRIVARVDELTGLLDRIEQRLAATNAAQAAFAGAAVHHVVA